MSEGQFPPTARKLKKARSEGDSARSLYVAEFAQLFCILMVLLVQFRAAWLDLQLLVQLSLSGLNWQLLTDLSFKLFCSLLFIPLLVSGMVGIALDHLQNILTPPGGVVWIPPSVKLDRFSLVGGIKRITSSIKRIPLLIFSTLILMLTALISIRWVTQSPAAALKQAVMLAFVSYLLVSCVDLILVRVGFIRRNRMSKQELLNELRDEEGDPRVKAQLRSMREVMNYQELSRRVKRSKVLVVSRQR